MLPALLLVLLFTLYPVAHTLWTSLHQVMILLTGEPFVGLANYRAVVSGPSSGGASATRLVRCVTARRSSCCRLWRRPSAARPSTAARSVRAVVILPWALPGAISAVIWIWIFHPSWGMLNLLLYETGLIERYIPWLTDPRWSASRSWSPTSGPSFRSPRCC